MTARPGRWDLLQRDSDPVPSDAEDVRSAARRFEGRADDLRTAHSTLSSLSRLDGWRGEAAETFAEKSDDALGDIKKAADKYAEAGRAVRSFASDVQSARDRSKTALDDAVQAEADRGSNSADPLDGVDDPTDAQKEEARAEAGRHDAAVGALAKARRDLEDTLADLDSAARSAADALGEASEKFDDSWWDDVKGAIRDIADVLVAICDVLEWIAVGLAVVALAIAIFATGPIWAVVATVVFVVGLVAAAGLLISRALLVVSESGKASWSDVAWDAVGLVASAFGGKAAIKATQAVPGLVSGAADAGRAAAPAVARTGLAQNAKNALNIADDANPLKAWALKEWDTGTDALRGAVTSAEQTLPTLAQRLRVLDTGAATNLGRIKALQAVGLPGMADDLASALRLQTTAVNLNLANTAISIDGAMDKFDVSLSGLGKDAADDIAQRLQNLHWRIAVAGK
jgi:uncharacterized protein YukE